MLGNLAENMARNELERDVNNELALERVLATLTWGPETAAEVVADYGPETAMLLARELALELVRLRVRQKVSDHGWFEASQLARQLQDEVVKRQVAEAEDLEERYPNLPADLAADVVEAPHGGDPPEDCPVCQCLGGTERLDDCPGVKHLSVPRPRPASPLSVA